MTKPGIICIGREYGSGGREVGERLAGLLDIPCYDKLLVREAAKRSGIAMDVLEQEEERPVVSDTILTGNVFADTALVTAAFYSGSQRVYEAERKTIEALAERGPCVIVGRCAASILRDRGCLSVFIYGRPEDRIARIERRNGLTEREAGKRMKKIDRMRKEYHNFYADTAWGRPESYDIMVSSSRYGVEGCARLLRESLAL